MIDNQKSGRIALEFYVKKFGPVLIFMILLVFCLISCADSSVSAVGVVGTWVSSNQGATTTLSIYSNDTFNVSGVIEGRGTYRLSGDRIYFSFQGDVGEQWGTISGNTLLYGGLTFTKR